MGFFERIDHVIDTTASGLVGPSHRGLVKIFIYFAVGAALVWVPYALVHHVYTSGFHVVSVQRESRVGQKMARQIEDRMTVLAEQDQLTVYVDEVGTQIALQNNPWAADFSFRVVRDPHMVNAFALPGGRIYITTGLLRQLDNEAELAGVLAHEVAHVSRRHYARNMGREMLMSWAKKFLGGTEHRVFDAGTFLTTSVTFLRMRQEDELEADYEGTLYIYDIGYDPGATTTLMQKLLDMEQKTPDLLRFFAMTHPPSSERLEALIDLRDTLPEKDTLSLGEERYREKVKGKLAATPNERRP